MRDKRDTAAAERLGRAERRRSKTELGSGAELACDALLAVVVVGSMLAIGTVYPVTLIAVTAPVVAAVVIAIRNESFKAPLRLSGPAMTFFGLALYTLFQAIPLPMGVVQFLAPRNADVWQRALLPFGVTTATWASISLDPGASYVEVLKWLVYAAIFVLSAAMSTRRGADWGIALVFGSAVVLSLVTLGHGLASATTVFGIYKPVASVAPWHVSPLLNPNNLAGYLNLGAMCGLGLLVARRPLLPRWVVGLGVATVVGVDVISGSRGGFLVLPLGVILFGVVQRALMDGNEERVSRRALPGLLAAAVGGGGILALLGGNAGTWQELYDKSLEKLSTVGWVKPLMLDHIWFGIGRGAFESVFPVYQLAWGNIIFSHAENFPAQWVSEWGAPISLAAMVTLAWLFRPNGMGFKRSSIVAGAWIGVLIVLMQNLLDLALELPAVLIGLSAALGSLWGDHRRRRVSRASPVEIQWCRATMSMKVLLIGTALVLSIAVVGTARAGIHDVGRDKQELYHALTHLNVTDTGAVSGFRADLRTAMLRHPAEPYFPLLGGLLAKSARDSSPLPWIQRTLERGNINPGAHLLLADFLVTKHATNQALMELRLAVQDEPTWAVTVAERAISLTRDFNELLRCVPSGKNGVAVLEALAAKLNDPVTSGTRERFEREALKHDPNHPGPHRALAQMLIERMTSRGDEVCVGEGAKPCEAEVQEHIAVLERTLPKQADADGVRASLLVAKGRADEGERLLAARCERVDDRGPCLRARLTVAAKVSSPGVLATAAKDALAEACSSPSDCAGLATLIGDLMSGRGDWGGASANYARATRDEPTEDRFLRLAGAASRLGAHAQAAEALQRVGEIRGHLDPDLSAQIKEHRAKALGLFER